LWFQSGELGIVIGLALITVLIFAALGGIFVPLTLNRMGIDPAVSSGPFVTSITDIVGFFAFLGIATAWFNL
jgi:magnesium transporter